MFPVRITLKHNPLINIEEDSRNPPLGPWMSNSVKGKWVPKIIEARQCPITGDSILEIDIYFENADEAMLFKLTWN
jgi:hypothetical protein